MSHIESNYPKNESDYEYVGFWVRVGAALIDTILVLEVIGTILMVADSTQVWDSEAFLYIPMDYLMLYLIIPAIATILFWKYMQATPGKVLFRAKIVDARTGNAPKFKQCIVRYIGYYLSGIAALGIGFLWIGWDSKKQGWHDKLAGTLVIHPKNYGTEHVGIKMEKGTTESDAIDQYVAEAGDKLIELKWEKWSLMKRTALVVTSILILEVITYGALYESPESDLYRAAAEGQSNTVVALLNEGIDVNAAQIIPLKHLGWTALMWASFNGHPDTINILLQHGANVDSSNYLFSTPLIAAALYGNIESVEMLLGAGANVNAQVYEGETALILAAAEGKIEIVQILLSSGADTSLEDWQGRTALMHAQMNNHHDIVYLLGQEDTK